MAPILALRLYLGSEQFFGSLETSNKWALIRRLRCHLHLIIKTRARARTRAREKMGNLERISEVILESEVA